MAAPIDLQYWHLQIDGEERKNQAHVQSAWNKKMRDMSMYVLQDIDNNNNNKIAIRKNTTTTRARGYFLTSCNRDTGIHKAHTQHTGREGLSQPPLRDGRDFVLPKRPWRRYGGGPEDSEEVEVEVVSRAHGAP
jgi:hypothetical protein